MARERSYTAGHFSASTPAMAAARLAAARASSTWRCSSSRRLSALPRLRRQALPRRAVGCEAGIEDKELSVSDVLDLTVAEAVQLFADRAVVAKLQPIVDVGLDYVASASPCPRSRAARRSA